MLRWCGADETGVHDLVDRVALVGEEHARAPRRGQDPGPWIPRDGPGRRRGEDVADPGAGLLAGGPRGEHPADRPPRHVPEPLRGSYHHSGDLPLPARP